MFSLFTPTKNPPPPPDLESNIDSKPEGNPLPPSSNTSTTTPQLPPSLGAPAPPTPPPGVGPPPPRSSPNVAPPGIPPPKEELVGIAGPLVPPLPSDPPPPLPSESLKPADSTLAPVPAPVLTKTPPPTKELPLRPPSEDSDVQRSPGPDLDDAASPSNIATLRSSLNKAFGVDVIPPHSMSPSEFAAHNSRLDSAAISSNPQLHETKVDLPRRKLPTTVSNLSSVVAMSSPASKPLTKLTPTPPSSRPPSERVKSATPPLSRLGSEKSHDSDTPLSPFTGVRSPTPPPSRPTRRTGLGMPRRNSNASLNGDELSWSRHSEGTPRETLRASIKYDEIEAGLRSPPAPLPPSIYFGGCAFGAAFYVGVYRALADMYGDEFYKDTIICGDSGGSIFAVGVSLGFDTEELYGMYMRICSSTRESNHYFYDPGSRKGASVFLAKELQWLLSEPTAFQTLNGNCMVGTTYFENKHVWHKEWRDNIEVFHSVMGSCHIPIYCAPNKRVLGQHVVDGAFSISGDLLPHGDETLFVGITDKADVYRRLTRTQMLTPPNAKEFADMEQTGYDAMWAWDGNLKRKVDVLEGDIDGIRLLWFLKGLELGWPAVLVIGIGLLAFIVLMSLHFQPNCKLNC